MSVGHVARAIESRGVATTSVYVKAFRHIVDEMMLPRAVVTPHPMGRPFGAPGDRVRQRQVVEAALSLASSARSRTVVEFPDPYRTVRSAGLTS